MLNLPNLSVHGKGYLPHGNKILGTNTITMVSATRTMKSPAGKVVKAVVKAMKPKATLTKKVASLTKQVSKLNKVSYEKVTTSAHYQGFTIGSLVSSSAPTQFQVILPNTAGPLFGANNADLTDIGKAYLNRVNVKVGIRQRNEPDLITHTVFLVSLKDEMNDPAHFNNSTGALTLTAGQHFAHWGSGNASQVMLNPKAFNVHKTWRTFTGGVVGGQTTQPAIRMKDMSFVPKKKLYENPIGNLFFNAAYVTPKDPSQCYYILIFNDNATGDGESPLADIAILTEWAIPS